MTQRINLISDDEVAGLPKNARLAFRYYEGFIRLRATNSKGDWISISYQRAYVTYLLAFVDESDMDFDFNRDIPIVDANFPLWFTNFIQSVNYHIGRLQISNIRGTEGGLISLISFSKEYKGEIGSLIGKIRKIISQTNIEDPKKDAIYKKIAALQLEIDRSTTRFDALMSRMLDLTNAVGKSAENIEPLEKLITRLWKTFGRAKEDLDQGELPAPDEQKQLPSPDDSG